MNTQVTLTEADLLTEVVEPNRATLSAQLAEELLSLRFNDDATDRIRNLLQKNNAGTINSSEKQTLDNYLHVSAFVPGIDELVRLFNPRADVWHDHFEWDGP